MGEQVNERVLAALYRKSDVNFTPNEQIDFEDKGIRLCADQLLRLRSAQPFSLFFSSGTTDRRGALAAGPRRSVPA